MWPIHSFMNHICFDHRLNVKMSSLTTNYQNPVIEFHMRVFRFRDPTEPAHTKQEQDIVCEIYLEEVESTYEEKQCECYTPDECSGKATPATTTRTTPTTTTKTTTLTTTKTTSTTSTKTKTLTTTKTTSTSTTKTTTITTPSTAPVTTLSNTAPTTSTALPSTEPKQTHTLKITGSVATNYVFKDELNNPESALFEKYASRVESDLSEIFVRNDYNASYDYYAPYDYYAAMIESVQVTVTGFKPVQTARKRRQAVQGNALAEFEALAEITKNVEFEAVQAEIEKEIESISWSPRAHIDASSFRDPPYNKMEFVFPTTQAITTASTPASSTTASPVDPLSHTPYSLNLRIEYKPNPDAYTWATNIVLERKCIGTLIANNVIITSSACCENIHDFAIINSAGGTNGMINTNGRYGGTGHSGHLSLTYFQSSFVCFFGQKKNGKCKKPPKRRRRDESGNDSDMICILKTPYDIVETFKMETIKERLKIH